MVGAVLEASPEPFVDGLTRAFDARPFSFGKEDEAPIYAGEWKLRRVVAWTLSQS